ncbi:peptidyl-prolyl cis-trans isomerase, rhodopsin-specific isozyme isoform X2 [Spodoptera frugiperda]|uniref:Peptidyl-prolyl cis-trans isomerase n=1 Tax=Spodoptera frugiperda TaxID=7108 RepID=A0A9R0DHU1_SPOFR|nr:peptidyl-prolyl cis-trans isomerase, rhodopsin-specific isozyme isoform X2 [Spodoptera frugiperda]
MDFHNSLVFLLILSSHLIFINARQFRVTDQVFFEITNEDKVLGRVVIGLFGDLAPKAVKNFKVLASKGINGKSYKGTSFTRIIKRFMVQGGDVESDDGTGSISIYGETFHDENLDTQHSGAGFVSMANKDHLHTVVGKVVDGQNVVHMLEHTPTDVDDKPLPHVYISDCGLIPTLEPYYISDDPYDLWAWIKASAVPLTMSFSILGFFQWMMRKMEI